MAAIDQTYPGSDTAANPLRDFEVVTPDDDTDLEYVSRALYVGGEGSVKVAMLGGTVVTLVGLPVGLWPLRVTRVFSTGTTASNILAGR